MSSVNRLWGGVRRLAITSVGCWFLLLSLAIPLARGQGSYFDPAMGSAPQNDRFIEPQPFPSQPAFISPSGVNVRLGDRIPSPGFSPSYGNGNAASLTGSQETQHVGYAGGFIIASPQLDSDAIGNSPYLLKINGWGQLRMTNFDSINPLLDFNQIQLKRARLIFSGHAMTPDFSWLISLDGRSQADNAIRLLDYYATFDFGHHWLGWDKRSAMIKLGQYKVPFTLARFVSAQELQFSDRSVASMFFDANRSLAYGVTGEQEGRWGRMTWEVAVFNGLITGGAETGSARSLDNNFAASGRLAHYFGEEWGVDDLCDFDYHELPAFRTGAAVARSGIDRKGKTEFNSIRVVDSGRELASLLPLETTGYQVSMYALDGSLKWRGLSVTGEYYFRNVGHFQGISQAGLFDHGFSLETGYFIIPQKLELLTRWSRVVGESGSLGSKNESSDERAVGAAWYFRRHLAKLNFDATYLDGAPIDSFSLDIDPGARGWLFRTQMQFGF
jgi:hypothetical protein